MVLLLVNDLFSGHNGVTIQKPDHLETGHKSTIRIPMDQYGIRMVTVCIELRRDVVLRYLMHSDVDALELDVNSFENRSVNRLKIRRILFHVNIPDGQDTSFPLLFGLLLPDFRRLKDADGRAIGRGCKKVGAFDSAHAEVSLQFVGSKQGVGFHGGQEEVEDLLIVVRVFLHLCEAEFDLKLGLILTVTV